MAMNDYKRAIRAIESSGGDYSAVGPVTASGNRAYGADQVMDFNVGPWTEKWFGKRLTPAEFLENPKAQDAVFEGQFGSYIDRFGNAQDAASMWFTGKPLAEGAGRKDILGTTGEDYVNKFNTALGDLRNNGMDGKSGGILNALSTQGGNDEEAPFYKRDSFKDMIGNLAIGLNSMRLNPDENLPRVIQAQQAQRKQKRDANRTLSWMRQNGYGQYADMIEAGRIDPKTVLGAIMQQQLSPQKDTRTALQQNVDYFMQMGYPQDEAIKMAKSGGTTINMPGQPAIKGDNIVVADPNEPSGYRFEPIGGSKADIERQAAAERRGKVAEQQAQKESVVSGSVDYLIGLLDKGGLFNLPEAGITGSILANLNANQEAVDFANELQTVQANIAFDRLQQMREASKTGGALGSVSEKELALLMNAYGNISQSTSAERLRTNLNKIKTIMDKIENDPVASAYYYGRAVVPDGAQEGTQIGEPY